MAHGRIEVLVRVARTGAAIFHRMPRPEEPDQREISAYSYAIHSRIRPGGADTEAPFPTGRPGTLAAGVAVRPGLKQEVDSCVDPLGRTPLIYACSKGALNSLTIGLVASLAKQGIRLNTVSPGMTATDMISDVLPSFDMSAIPLGRVGTPDEIANVIVWLCSEEASYVAGANVRIAGGRPPGTTLG